ncbi:MAG: hypothetical protein IJS62_02810 [Bacteroidales bacterium]|nr:hypothetical protein [Bacteroidales bacterium]
MKTRYFYFIAAAALLVAGCAKEIPQGGDVISEGRTVLEVGLPGSKTHMGELSGTSRKIYWSNGDQLALNGTPSAALADIEENASSATFSWDGLLTPPYKLLYPASIYEDATHVRLPAIQSYSAGGFAEGMNPMAGYTTSGSGTISLSHLCAIVKISILRSSDAEADTDNIATVRFKGKNAEKVSGSFEIDYENATLTQDSGSATELEVRVNKSLATSTSKAVEYFLVVPARTYANGFDIDVIDVNGHKMTKSKASSWTAEAGHLYNMPEFEFVPTGTELGVEISNADELVQFAKDYNEGVYNALGSNLLVTLTDDADIAFDATSSAAFSGIGRQNGIGGATADNYFSGTFDGNNKTISGLESIVPLFVATDSGSTIKDLTVDETCSFIFTHSNTIEGRFGSIAGYHKGVLDNVKSAANVSLAAVSDVTQMTTLGGLVGRATVGKLQNNCEYSGLISTPAEFTTTGKLIIGGLVGRFSNIGSVTGCNFKGAISNAAHVTSIDKGSPYLIIGGIAGHVNGSDQGKVATITSCETTTEYGAIASAHPSLSAVIVNKTTVAYFSAVGGIVGELGNGEVSSCTNAATIGNSIFRGSDASGRYIKSGGIVGRNAEQGVITGCTNNGRITHRSNPRIQALGGIAGYNIGTITGCTNNAIVEHLNSSQSIPGARSVNLGGVIGENYADNMVSDVHNTAGIEVSSLEAVDNTEERIGGVIGYNEGIVVGGATKDITNSGQVYHSSIYDTQCKGFYLGGIVGLTKAAVKNARNSGRPYFRWNGTEGIGAGNAYIGGIAGKAEGTSSTIENCDNIVESDVSNSAQVYLYLPGTQSHNDNYVGGIVGLTEATDPVKDCTNGGEVRTAAGASPVPVTGIMMGGIIGKMTGSGEVNNADNSGRVRINFMVAEEGHSGNYLGGIIGYVVSESVVTVTGCDNSGGVDSSNGAGLVQDIIVSGVVGKMDAPGIITNSNNNGGAIQMLITANSVGPKDLYTAGILGKSEQDVTITGCSNTGAISGGNSTNVSGTAFYMGGIAAYMKGASKILDCSNTGSTVSSHSGNNDNIGSTALVSGVVGYAEGTSETPFEIGGTTGCTVNTSAALNATRGWIAGIAAYAKYATISKCNVSNVIDAACRGAGGIVGKAEYCSISTCNFNGTKIKANQIQTGTGEGGIVGNAANTTIDGCYCYATQFLNNTSKPFGGIVGISGSNNTISNCHYKATVTGPTTSTTGVTATIVASGTYTDGGGNAADL